MKNAGFTKCNLLIAGRAGFGLYGFVEAEYSSRDEA
ncbi:uncharacterized protein METZ01_LOCUS246877 [marine metagenome]|uniref:Uncharacterized protein n=1 Tax=marine metagenome TaxID=408172 RepID=A0A382I5A9_9ZZZZ